MEIDNNKNIDEIFKYIDMVCSKIKNKRVHQEVESELLTHMIDLYNEYSTNDTSTNNLDISSEIFHEHIINKVLNHMGDCEYIGNKLNKVHTSKIDWGIIMLTCLMTLLGLIFLFIFHKLGAFDLIYGVGTMHIFENSLLFGIIGTIALFLASFIDFRIFKTYSIFIYILSILLLFSSKLFEPVNGVQHWIRFGSVTINVFQLCPALFIFSISGTLADINWKDKRNLIKGLTLGVIPFLLFVLNSSLFASITYGISLIALLVITKLNTLSALSTALFGFIIIFINKGLFENKAAITNKIYENNYLHLKLNSMLENSNLLGQASSFNLNSIPDFYTDYAFAYIVYNFGWLIGILLLLLITFLLIKIFKVAFIARNSFAKLLVFGLSTMLSIQFIWHILINIGILPKNYVPLPIIGYGGSSIIISLFLIGVIINVYRGKTLTKVTFDL